MKATTEKSILLFVSFLLTGFVGKTQIQSNNIELGVGYGAYVYQGDLTPGSIGSFRTMKPGIHLFAGKIATSNLSYRLNVAISGLKGDESKYSTPEYRQQRNFKFKTPLFEISGLGIWDIRGNNYNRNKGVFSPYLFSGFGLSFLSIRRDWNAMNTEIFNAESEVQIGLNTDVQKKLPKMLPFIPVGLGFRYEISNRFAATTESAYRFVFTDYLDGFSHSANPKKEDHYLSQTVGLIYKLGRKNTLDCPRIKY
jgi:hypothetical protein